VNLAAWVIPVLIASALVLIGAWLGPWKVVLTIGVVLAVVRIALEVASRQRPSEEEGRSS
jgi:hypothetical protein